MCDLVVVLSWRTTSGWDRQFTPSEWGSCTWTAAVTIFLNWSQNGSVIFLQIPGFFFSRHCSAWKSCGRTPFMAVKPCIDHLQMQHWVFSLCIPSGSDSFASLYLFWRNPGYIQNVEVVKIRAFLQLDVKEKVYNEIFLGHCSVHSDCLVGFQLSCLQNVCV